MKRIALALGFTALCGAPAFAVELDPNVRSRAVDAAGKVVAPAPARDPLPDLQYGVDMDGRTLSGACATNKTDLCYDSRAGRLIYRPSRNWMPEISGLRPEHISVRRDKIIFQYSFK